MHRIIKFAGEDGSVQRKRYPAISVRCETSAAEPTQIDPDGR